MLSYVKLVTEYCQQQGLDSADLFCAAGLPRLPDDSGGEPERIPFRQFMALCECAAMLLQDDALGLKLGRAIKPGYYGIHGHAVMSARTLGECLDRSERFHRLVHDGGCNLVARRGDQVIMSYHSNIPELDDLGRLQNDLSLAAWISFARWLGCITDYPLDWVSFTHDQPMNADLYGEIFECPVQFGTAQNAIAFPAHFLALPNPQTNPVILRIMDDLSERALLILQPIHGPDWLHRARHLISQSLHLGLPSLDQLATQLAMTPRQLRQELKKHNLLFTSLLEETRKHLAQGYLRDPELSYADIAFMLGFSEQSAFNRAFRRWTHSTPSQYRLSLR